MIFPLVILSLLTLQGGHTPLYIASQNGHDKVVKLLVLAGADLHIANTEVCAHNQRNYVSCFRLYLTLNVHEKRGLQYFN